MDRWKTKIKTKDKRNYLWEELWRWKALNLKEATEFRIGRAKVWNEQSGQSALEFKGKSLFSITDEVLSHKKRLNPNPLEIQ